MAVKNSALLDLIETTLPDLPEQYFEITWDRQDYEFCRIYQTERMEVDGGTSIKRKLMLDDTGNARYRRNFDVDEPAVGDVMQGIEVPWTQIGTHYSWEKMELIRQRNSAKGFIRLLDTRRAEGLWSLAKLIENRAWKTPTNSSDDLNPYGVPYYINMLDADSSDAGFEGKTIRFQDGTTDTVCAGLDADTHDKWRNYAAVYTKVNNDMLRTFRKAFLLTRFKAPMFINDPAQKRNAAKRIYCDADTAVALQDLADSRDDNHKGKDVLGNIRVDEGGIVYINRIPVQYIPDLDGAVDPVTSGTTKPMYCVDFEKFIPYIQEGYWMEESDPMNDRRQHTTFTVFLDGAHNNLCVNRRQAGFVLHTPIVSA